MEQVKNSPAYWALAIAIVVGIIFAWGVTRFVKGWRKDHGENPMLGSELYLFAMVSGGLMTSCFWMAAIAIGTVPDSLYWFTPIVGLFCAFITPKSWDAFIALLSWKWPDLAAQVAGWEKPL